MELPCACGHAATEVYVCPVRDVYTCPRCWEREVRLLLICGVTVEAVHAIERFGRYAWVGEKVQR